VLYLSALEIFHVPGPDAPKKYLLKNFANFSRTIQKYNIKFYTLVTHSIVRKFGKFRHIIYITDKITLFLVMTTLQLRRYQKLSKLFKTAQTP